MSRFSARTAFLVSTLVLTSTVSTFAAVAPVGTPSANNGSADKLISDFGKTEGHMTIGLDLMAIAKMQRDTALGYPVSGIGANLGLGVEWRKYITKIPQADVRKAAEEIAAASPSISYDEFQNQVKKKLNKNLHTFWGLNTVALIIPGAEFGVSYDLTDAKGVGMQLNGEILWNLGLIIPVPAIGFQYSF